MMKKIIISIFVVLALLLVFRDLIIKQAVVSVGSSVLGAPVKVGGLSLSLLTSRIKITDFKIYNPANFSSNTLIDIAHIDVQYDLPAIVAGKLYFSLIDLDIRQLAIERNKQNEFNVASLKIKPQESSKPLDMRIDVLKLNVDQVMLRDDTKNAVAQEMSHGVGLHKKTFNNITSPQQLVALVLFESSGLGTLKDIAMVTTKHILSGVKYEVGNVSGQAKKALNAVFGAVKSAVK